MRTDDIASQLNLTGCCRSSFVQPGGWTPEGTRVYIIPGIMLILSLILALMRIGRRTF